MTSSKERTSYHDARGGSYTSLKRSCWSEEWTRFAPTRTNFHVGFRLIRRTPSDARVLHGGSWCVNAYIIRTAYRSWDPPSGSRHHVGFRLIRNSFNLKSKSYDLRGGSWYSYAGYCRSAYRRYGIPSYGNSGLGLRLTRRKKDEEHKS